MRLSLCGASKRRRIVCSPGLSARHPVAPTGNSADSIGCAASSDVTSTRARASKSFSVVLYNVVIANGRFAAGGLPIAPNADPSDGLLDIILIPERLGSEITLLAAKIVLGNHLDADAVVFRRAARVSIRSRPGMWFTVDGELIGNDPIEFEVMPRALQFVVGKR
jgi:diacylglycerol kinase family enzyme